MCASAKHFILENFYNAAFKKKYFLLVTKLKGNDQFPWYTIILPIQLFWYSVNVTQIRYSRVCRKYICFSQC